METSGSLAWFSAELKVPDGTQPLYFRFEGEGSLEFYAFELK